MNAIPPLSESASIIDTCINCGSPGNLIVTMAVIAIGAGLVALKRPDKEADLDRSS
jgi:hypothetical protein